MAYTRHTAKRVWVADLHAGRYARQDDVLNFVELGDGQQVFRACLMGLVVGIDDCVWVDDGTGSVAVRTFDGSFDADIGSCVLVIGRPREFSGQKYLMGEVLKKSDQRWFDVWKKTVPRVVAVGGRDIVDESSKGADIVSIVRSLDQGDGADYDAVVSRLGSGGEDKIVHLLAIGELFETKPGKLKVLE